jgi:hypothetical protein
MWPVIGHNKIVFVCQWVGESVILLALFGFTVLLFISVYVISNT